MIARLSTELKAVLAAPDVKERFASQGFAASWSSPPDYGQFLSKELQKWAEVIRVSGAKVD